MIPPVLDVDAAIIHVATVLIEQGYMAEDAYQAAERIVYKCAIACTTSIIAKERYYERTQEL